jgi:hypothetical protein
MPYPDDTQQILNYNHYGSQNDYVVLPGVCILPLAEDPPTTKLSSYSPVVIARLHAPYRIRKYTTRSDKVNNPPPMPQFGDSGAFVFINGVISLGNTLNSTYSNFDWEVGTEYTYVENCVIRAQDGLVLGTPPFSQNTSQINSEQYQGTIPTIGAVAYAGSDVLVGYWQGQQIVVGGSQGTLNGVWGYNTTSFYPGQLFYTDLANGGTSTIVPPINENTNILQ